MLVAFPDVLTRADHLARMDRRIGAKDFSAATRTAKRVGSDQVAIVKACIAAEGKSHKRPKKKAAQLRRPFFVHDRESIRPPSAAVDDVAQRRMARVVIGNHRPRAFVEITALDIPKLPYALQERINEPGGAPLRAQSQPCNEGALRRNLCARGGPCCSLRRFACRARGQPRRAREKARTIELASPSFRSRQRVRLRPTRSVQSDPPPSGPSARCDTNDTKSMGRDIVSIPKRAMSHVAEGNGRFSCASSVLLLRQA